MNCVEVVLSLTVTFSLINEEIIGEAGGFGRACGLKVSVADLGLNGRHEKFSCARRLFFVAQAAATGRHVFDIVQVAAHRLISANFED